MLEGRGLILWQVWSGGSGGRSRPPLNCEWERRWRVGVDERIGDPLNISLKLQAAVHSEILSSPGTNFDPTDFCHLRRRSNLLICLFAIFGLNDYVVLFCFNSVTSKCAIQFCPIDADCRALCPGPSYEEVHLSSVEQKKLLFGWT